MTLDINVLFWFVTTPTTLTMLTKLTLLTMRTILTKLTKLTIATNHPQFQAVSENNRYEEARLYNTFVFLSKNNVAKKCKNVYKITLCEFASFKAFLEERYG